MSSLKGGRPVYTVMPICWFTLMHQRPETQPVLATAPSTLDQQEVLMLTIWEYNAKNNAKKRLHCFSHYLTDPILPYLLGRICVQRKWACQKHLWHSLHATRHVQKHVTNGSNRVSGFPLNFLWLAPASRQCCLGTTWRRPW